MAPVRDRSSGRGSIKLELRTARPVLSADDLTFIIDGLNNIRVDLVSTAVELAKGSEYEAAGETLGMNAEVDGLILRMNGLRAGVINAMLADAIATEAEQEAAIEASPEYIATETEQEAAIEASPEHNDPSFEGTIVASTDPDGHVTIEAFPDKCHPATDHEAVEEVPGL